MKNLKNDLFMIFKGIKEVSRLCPTHLPLLCVRSVLEALLPFVNIYISALIIDAINIGQSYSQLLIYAIVTVSLNLACTLILRGVIRFSEVLWTDFYYRYNNSLSSKIMDMDYVDVEDAKVHKMHEDINLNQNLSSGGLWRILYSCQGFIKHFFTIVFSVSLTVKLFVLTANNDTNIVYRLVCSPMASIMIIVCILLNIYLAMNAGAKKITTERKILNTIVGPNRTASFYIDNYISSYHAGKDIRLYNQKGVVIEEISYLIGMANDIFNKLIKNSFKYSSVNTVASVAISLLVYLFVGVKALAGLCGIGDIVKYIGSITQFTTGFTGLMETFAALRANNPMLKTYFDFMELPSKFYHGTLPVEKRTDNDYEIEFKNLSFKYPSNDKYALKNLSLKLNVGQRLAVVGMNGSGKTTFIKLLCRLYDPDEGEILLNGYNIKKYDYKEYLSIFSVVFQDFKLFSVPLGQNVAAMVDYDIEQAKAALCKAGFETRLESMPKGLETCLYKDFEEDGVEISGGEAQKIAIARTIYKDSPFIILDEPTAALDPISEFEIYTKFNEIVGEKTAIYISHRLSSCRFCNEIIVFHEGELVQRGSHDTLLKDKNGKYFELWNAQAQYYTENKQNILT